MARLVIKRSLKRIIRHFHLARKRDPDWATHNRIMTQVVAPLRKLDRYGIDSNNFQQYL